MFLATLSLACAASAEVLVLRDGSRVDGRVTMCDEEYCVVSSKRVLMENIALIELVSAMKPPAGAKSGAIVFIDGTVHSNRFLGLNLGVVVDTDDVELDRNRVALIVVQELTPPTPSPTRSDPPAPPPTTPATRPPESASEAAVPQPTAALLLNEVLFLPSENQAPFVEIRNTGTVSAALDGVTLRNDKGMSFALPKGGMLAPGALLIVRFDGAKDGEEGVVHAPSGDFLGREAGAIWLATGDGNADAVAWGLNKPRAVELCRGGRCTAPRPGSVVARLPDVAAAFSVAAWAALDPEHATPGRPNPRPPVSVFAARPGTIYVGQPRFSWYSVSGAVRYRVEVARDEDFAALAHEAIVSATPGVPLEQLTAAGPNLPPGSYFWRVQAFGARGDAAAFSRPVPFAIKPTKRSARVLPRLHNSRAQALGGGVDDPPSGGSNAISALRVCPGLALAAGEGTCKELPVPVIEHQKDTQMLTLEAPNEEPPMGWDKPDFAGYPYCARAGVAMVNAYYDGKLSQDRIGYEVFKHLPGAGGPEYDLPVVGINNLSTDKYSLPLALGTSGVYHQSPMPFAEDSTLCRQRNIGLRCGQTSPCPPCPPELRFHWGYEALRNIKAEIDADRPLIVTGPGHLYLIVGYVERGDEFSIITQDGGGRFEENLQQNDGEVRTWVDGRDVIEQMDGNEAVSLQFLLDAYWTGLAAVKVGNDEPSISKDSDNDGVMDFDEVERFETKMHERDSDGDGVGDKEEIHYSVWDLDYGYHKTVGTFSPTASESEVAAKAENALREPMEIVKDSDNGGCDDGRENDDRDGRRAGAETSNFVRTDDVLDEQGKCAQLWIGTVHSTVQLEHNHLMTTTVEVRLREVDPKLPRVTAVGAGEYVDLVSEGSVVTQTHSTLGGSCTFTGHGTSAAVRTAGQIMRTIESVGPAGEIHWSPRRYIVGLAPAAPGGWTKHCPDPKDWAYGQSTWVHEGQEGWYSVNIGGGDDPQIRILENGRMFGSYIDHSDDGQDDSVSWSICPGGTECPAPPSPP